MHLPHVEAKLVIDLHRIHFVESALLHGRPLCVEGNQDRRHPLVSIQSSKLPSGRIYATNGVITIRLVNRNFYF